MILILCKKCQRKLICFFVNLYSYKMIWFIFLNHVHTTVEVCGILTAINSSACHLTHKTVENHCKYLTMKHNQASCYCVHRNMNVCMGLFTHIHPNLSYKLRRCENQCITEMEYLYACKKNFIWLATLLVFFIFYFKWRT